MTPVAKGSAPANIRNQPAYTVAEAARYLRISAATLRTWVAGRDYRTNDGSRHWPLLITPASTEPRLLSFWNLIEAHVLWGLRTDHSVPVKHVRQALDFAEKKLGIEHLLLRRELFTSARSLFLDHYGELIHLSASGQIAMRQVLEAHLRRVEWDAWEFPVRLYPFTPADGIGQQPTIAIDPAIAFGRPIMLSRGVATEVLVSRIDAGESIEDLAADYDLTTKEIEQAVVYERTA